MGKMKHTMLELRQLRNASKGLLRDDMAFLKGERGGKTVGPRFMNAAGSSVRDVAGAASEFAGQNKLKIGTGLAIGAGVLTAWIFRDRIERAVGQAIEYMRNDEAGDIADDQAPAAENWKTFIKNHLKIGVSHD